MIFGMGIFAVGYAVFYWGLHHFPNVDGGERYSLITLLGIPEAWGIAQGQPVGLLPGGQLSVPGFGNNPTGGMGANLTSENTVTANNLTGGSDWIAGILSGLGAPNSSNNQAKLNAWNACEGNLAGHSGLGINNPFNTTLSCCGALGSVNSAGVKSYPSLTAGISATLQTLQSPSYAAIIQNLVSDGSQQGFAAAVGSSPWGTSGTCIAGTV